MARRRRNRDVNLNLDSLLDTMFNVVGILVLVVVLAQLNAGQAVNRLSQQLANLPDVSPEALAEAKQRAKDLQQQIDRLSSGLEVDQADLEDKRITLDRLKGQIERLKKLAALDPQLQQKHQRVVQTRDKLRRQKEELKSEVNQASEDLQDLNARLAETEPTEQLPDKVVRLPRPRSAPEGWQPLFVLVANDKLYIYRRPSTEKQLREVVSRLPKRPETEQRVAGIDRDAFIEGFRDRTSNHRYFALKGQTVGKYNRMPRFAFIPREEAGLSEDQLQGQWSELMRKMRRNQRYVRFLVKPDSFDMYLAAREVTDKHKVPAGWEIVQPDWTYHDTLNAENFRLTQSKAKIQAIDERLAKRDNNNQQQKDEDADIPPPKVKRDVDGPID
jgi:hypothetical protein